MTRSMIRRQRLSGAFIQVSNPLETHEIVAVEKATIKMDVIQTDLTTFFLVRYKPDRIRCSRVLHSK